LPITGISDSLAGTAAAWTAAGAGSTLVWAGIGSLAVSAVPGNRGGATSVYSAFRFGGVAVAPLVWLPLFHARPWLPFALGGLLCVLMSGLSVRLDRVRPA
jgi:hypothetical protein